MANPEYQARGNASNVVETLALFLLGRIKREDLDENNQTVLGFYLGLMDDDPRFKNDVITKKKEMQQAAEIGRRISLFTDEELENARKHRKHKETKIETHFQPELFKVEPSVFENTGVFDHQSIIDPGKQLAKLHREFEEPLYLRNKNSLVNEDIRYLQLKLRNIIGLPIARGKDPHVGDRFYKFLVRRIVRDDIFRIFTEFSDYKYDEPSDLDARISQVKDFVSEVLNNNAGLKERYANYNQFVDIYNNEWGK